MIGVALCLRETTHHRWPRAKNGRTSDDILREQECSCPSVISVYGGWKADKDRIEKAEVLQKMQLHGVQENLPFAALGFSPPAVIPFVVTSPQCCHVSPPPVTKGQEDRKCYIIFTLHLLNTAQGKTQKLVKSCDM